MTDLKELIEYSEPPFKQLLYLESVDVC